MIKGLGTQRFVSEPAITPPETENVTAPQQAVPPSREGISSFTDSFETATPNQDAGLLFALPPQADTYASNSSAEPYTVDAAAIFDFQEAPTQPPPPTPQEDGLGKTLEDVTEKKIQDTYRSKTTKDFGPDPKGTSNSTKYGDADMPQNLSNLGGGGGTTVGDLQGSWNAAEFAKIDEKAEGDWGSAYAKGSTKVIALDGQVYYNIGVDPEKKTISVGAGAKGSAEIVGAHYEFGYSTPDIELGNSQVDVDAKVNADAWVGAKGNAGGGITLGGENNASLEAGGFAGGRASLAGDIGVGDAVDGTGYIAGWTGVGAKAGAKFGFKDGEFSMKAGVGLALGLGLEWDLGLKVDFGRVARLGLDGMREVGLGDEANWISDRADDLVSYAGDAAHWAGDSAEDATKAIEQATKDATDAALKAAGAAFGWVGHAAEDPGDAVDDVIETGEDIIDGAGDLIDDAGDFLDDLW